VGQRLSRHFENGIRKFSFATISAMSSIKAAWCRKLVNISALADKADLEYLDIRDCAVEEFSGLRGKAKLKHLNLSGTVFADLSIIGASKALNSLNIDKTKVVDITPLQKFTQLKRVTVPTSVPSEQIDALKKALPNVRLTQK
jgi:Leucine-rich repeat (LRR) protein